jgi:hypothetical protein
VVQGLKPGGFKLRVNWIQREQPPPRRRRLAARGGRRCVAVQVDNLKANSETSFHISGSKGLKQGGFKLLGLGFRF